MAHDLAQLAADYHDHRHRTAPTSAHLRGDYRFADRVEAVSRADEDRVIGIDRDFARRALAIPEDALTPDERITRELIGWDGNARADIAEARLAELDVDPIGGPQAMLPVYLPKLGMPTAEVAQAMLAKVAAIGGQFRELGERHREGLASGRVPVGLSVGMVVEQLDRWLGRPVAQDPLRIDPPASIADPDAWRSRLDEVIASEVRPAVAAYRDLLRDEIEPAARSEERAGLCWLPDGEEAYGRYVRFYTTLDKAPQEIHEIGLAQVERLAGEYRELGREALATDDLQSILEGLRSDPSLHHTSGAEIVAASEVAMARAKAAMGEWFGILPRADCHVEEIQSGAIAFYFPPAADGSRGGVFFMNTSDPAGWGRYEIESTSFHEGIPGHHLQLAIASELTAIPEFRKRMFIAAYGEGWGLYAERLADEMGLYSSPLDRLGMLSADSMRACRLVVDTGIHALGWSRDRAIEYMLANSPMRRSHVAAEIDRYITTPGQALAYMLGRLEIQRIRREAEARLGPRFSIQGFHDAVLGSGPLPLPVLGRVVAAWAEAAAA